MYWFYALTSYKIITTIALANTSILSHNYHLFLCWEHLRITLLAAFKYSIHMFSSKNFSTYIYSMIHFELIFVCGTRRHPSLIHLLVHIHCPSTIYWIPSILFENHLAVNVSSSSTYIPLIYMPIHFCQYQFVFNILSVG